MAKNRMQVQRGTKEELDQMSPSLADGEIGFVNEIGKEGLFIGNAGQNVDMLKASLSTFDNEGTSLKAKTVQEAIEELAALHDNDLTMEIGVRFLIGSKSPVGERVKRVGGVITYGEATGLVHNVGVDDQVVENSFDNLYLSRRERVVFEDNHFILHPLRYTKVEIVEDDEEQTWEIWWWCATKLTGYEDPLAFRRKDGSIRDYFLAGVHEGWIDGSGKLRSVPNVHPTVEDTGINFLTAARLNDGLGTNSKYTSQDLARTLYLVHINTIMFATKNSQSKLVGATNMSYASGRVTIGSQSNSNQVVLTNAQASTFELLQSIGGGTSYSNNSVFGYRQITQIEVDTPVAGQTTITFDGAPVASIPENTVIGSRGWKTGMLDGVVATDGAFRANKAKMPIKVGGIENLWGNIYQNIAGLKVKGDKYFFSIFPEDYNYDESTTNYTEISYDVPATNGYVVELGRDLNNPLVLLPSITVGGSDAEYYADYFYQNYSANAYRSAFFGGRWYNDSPAGLFFWSVNNVLSSSFIALGSRLFYLP